LFYTDEKCLCHAIVAKVEHILATKPDITARQVMDYIVCSVPSALEVKGREGAKAFFDKIMAELPVNRCYFPGQDVTITAKQPLYAAKEEEDEDEDEVVEEVEKKEKEKGDQAALDVSGIAGFAISPYPDFDDFFD